MRAAAVKQWMDNPENFAEIKESFGSARLDKV